MSKHFRSWDPKQKWLLPPEITEFIPEGHASHFVRNLVVEQLEPPKVDPKAQRNFTDPESRIMPTKNGFEQCFNAQAAVDAKAQVIVACDVVATSADCPQLLPVVDMIKANLGRKPKVGRSAGARRRFRLNRQSGLA